MKFPPPKEREEAICGVAASERLCGVLPVRLRAFPPCALHLTSSRSLGARTKILGIIFTLLFGGPAGAGDPRAVELNNRAAAEILLQDSGKALEHLSQAIGESPYEAEVHYNIGLAMTLRGEPDKAEQSYLSALKLNPSPELRFKTLFNLAELNGKKSQIDVALNYYQKALEIVPNSEEVKTNIELLTQNNGQGKDGQGQGKNQGQDKDSKENQNKDGQEKKEQGPEEKKQYAKNPKPQPRQFKSEELSQSDVNKILGEIKQQEQKIRREYNKKEVKERPRDKSW